MQPYGVTLDPAYHLVAEFRPIDMLNWARQYTFGNTATFNGEVETYLPANVFIDVTTGDLVLEGRNTGGGDPATGYSGKYTSGMIASYNAVSFKYGYLEGYIKLGAGKGVWPAFWMLLTTYPQSNEFDIVELFEDPFTLHRGIHYENPPGTKLSNGGQTTTADLSQGYNHFALEWTPEFIKYYFNGTLIYTNSDPVANSPDVMYILCNLALGGIVTTGVPDDSQFPIKSRLKYIRLWQRNEATSILTLTPQAPSFGTYEAAILSYAPGYYYRCDEPSGTVATDQSGNGHNGTYPASGVTFAQTGVLVGDVDKAVAFNGTAGYLATPFDPAGHTKLSVLGSFVMPSLIGNDGRFAASGHTDANNNGMQMVIRSAGAGGLVSVGWGTDALNVYWTLPAAALLQAGAVYDYGMAFDGKTLTVFINGAQVGSGNTGSTRTISSTGFPINFGRGPYSGGADYCAIKADELAIFPDIVLTAVDFAALHARAITSPDRAVLVAITDVAPASVALTDSGSF